MGKLIDADAYLKSIRPRGIADELWKTSEAYLSIMRMPPVDAIPIESIEELEQLDYELYCHIGKSHLSEQQWEWLKGVLKNETN